MWGIFENPPFLCWLISSITTGVHFDCWILLLYFKPWFDLVNCSLGILSTVLGQKKKPNQGFHVLYTKALTLINCSYLYEGTTEQHEFSNSFQMLKWYRWIAQLHYFEDWARWRKLFKFYFSYPQESSFWNLYF